MKGSVEFTADGRMNTKANRARDVRRSQGVKGFDAYKSNSTKEELCFEYINSFQRQFHSMNPKRKSLLMATDNEFGVKKFVCSTIRPTQLPFSELYDMYECASFLAGYILYEPLDPPTELPKYLFSPTQTLDSHTGDSFDIATVLCSFLLGNGYDAYVVSGYAHRHVTLRDQSLTQCPMITEAASTMISKQEFKSDNAVQNSYVAPDNKVKESVFLATESEKKRISELDTFRLWIPEELEKSAQQQADDDGLRRVHAWVLVCAGRRDVKEHTFLEPSNGRAYMPSNCPYIGIESVWNNTNYFVNVVPDSKISDVDFDLQNTAVWEYLFLGPPKSDDEAQQEEGHDPDHGDAGDKAHTPEESKADDAFTVTRTFDAPPTWVNPLQLDRLKYLKRFPPHGKRTTQYFKAKVDVFARNINPQSMVMRIVQYLDVAKTIVSEIHEWFENRKDKMYKRIRYYLGKAHFIEYYHPGSVGEVKQWTEYSGKLIQVDFHVNGRLDRMSRREEVIGSNVSEHFEGRSDRLVHRSIDLTVDKFIAGARQFSLAGGTLAPEIFVLKMTQSFEEDPTVVPGTDIAERAFFVREGKAIVKHHFGKSQITCLVKTYMHTRGPSVPTISDLAMSQEVNVVDDSEQLLEVVALERECFASVKANFQQMQKIHEFREESESAVVIQPSVFDVALDKAAQDAHASKEAQSGAGDRNGDGKDLKSGFDYLAPFLRNLKDPQRVTKEEAMEIRQNALDALKARLVERANIVQTRLNDENAKLGRKQEQFQRSQREGDLSTEEYEKYCTEAMFRIQILEQRLVAHEESSLKKFQELDQRLALDPRLKVLRN